MLGRIHSWRLLGGKLICSVRIGRLEHNIFFSDPRDCGAITCSVQAARRDYQLWDLKRVGRSGEEIKAIIRSWKPDLLDRLLEPHKSSAE